MNARAITPGDVLCKRAILNLEVHGVGPKHVAVKRFAHLVDGRLPPAPGVITEGAVLWSSR